MCEGWVEFWEAILTIYHREVIVLLRQLVLIILTKLHELSKEKCNKR